MGGAPSHHIIVVINFFSVYRRDVLWLLLCYCLDIMIITFSELLLLADQRAARSLVRSDELGLLGNKVRCNFPLQVKLFLRCDSENSLIAPTALRAWVVIECKSFLAWVAEQLDIRIVAQLFANPMHEPRKDITREKVNDIVRSQEAKRDPDINYQSDAECSKFIPTHGQILRREDSGRAHMPRKVKIVRVKVGNSQRVNTWIEPEEADWTTHEKDGLDDVAYGVEHAQSHGETHGRPSEPVDEKI